MDSILLPTTVLSPRNVLFRMLITLSRIPFAAVAG